MIRKDRARQNLIEKLPRAVCRKGANVEGEINALGIIMDTENLIVTAVEIDDFRLIEERFSIKEVDVFIQTFLDISKEILIDWEKSVITHTSRGKFAMIFTGTYNHSRMYIHNRYCTFLNRIRSEIKNI